MPLTGGVCCDRTKSQIRYSLSQKGRRSQCLFQRISGRADLDEQRTGGQVLIEPFCAEIDGPAKTRKPLLQLGLELRRQGEVFFPVGMLPSSCIGTHHQHHLRRFGIVDYRGSGQLFCQGKIQVSFLLRQEF